jgi:hypothetical protein
VEYSSRTPSSCMARELVRFRVEVADDEGSALKEGPVLFRDQETLQVLITKFPIERGMECIVKI